MYMIWVWLAICVAAVIIELATPQLVSIWFGVGSFVCMWLAFIPEFPWWAQVLVFAVVSCASLFGLRPLFRRYLDKRRSATNVDSLIGKHVRMLTEANFDNLGSAKIGDVVWSIKSDSDAVLPLGAIVEVVSVDGNKLLARLVSDAQVSSDKDGETSA